MIDSNSIPSAIFGGYIDSPKDTNGKLDHNRIKSIIVHEFAHYKLKHYESGNLLRQMI